MNERSKIFSVTITPRGIDFLFAAPQSRLRRSALRVSGGRTFIMLCVNRQGQSLFAPGAVDLTSCAMQRI